MLSACSTASKEAENNDAAIVTRTVRNMEMLESKNGKSERIMRAPLMEDHAFADPAYTEYTRGVEMVGFDSLGVNPASNILADYAIFWSAGELWELKGNVLAEGEDDRRLYTQQLFYNARTGKVWSNVDCKFEMGEDVFLGVGFDAQVDLSYAAIRNMTGYTYVEVGSEDGTALDEEGAAGTDGGDASANAALDAAAPDGAGNPVVSGDSGGSGNSGGSVAPATTDTSIAPATADSSATAPKPVPAAAAPKPAPSAAAKPAAIQDNAEVSAAEVVSAGDADAPRATADENGTPNLKKTGR